MALPKYKIAKNPKNKLWYVVGIVRGKTSYYMPVSSGYKKKSDATAYMKKLPSIEKAQYEELRGM